MNIWVPLKENRNYNQNLTDAAMMIIAGGSNGNGKFEGNSTDANAAKLLAQTTGGVAVRVSANFSHFESK